MKLDPSLRALSIVALSLVAAACSGTGAGDTGDPPSTEETDIYGDGDRLSDLVGPATWLNPQDPDSLECDKPEDRYVEVSGVTVIAVDRFDEVGEGATGNVYAMDTPGKKGPKPYSGITIFDPSFSPPDLRIFGGEVVDVSGSLLEFLGPSSGPFGACKTLPEIGGTMTFRFDSTGVEPLVLIPASDTRPAAERWAALRSYEAARPYMGMLVRIENVQLATPDPIPEGVGRWSVPINVGGGLIPTDVPRISNELYDITGTGPAIAENAVFTSITGVVTYFYGFKIAPRSPADFVR